MKKRVLILSSMIAIVIASSTIAGSNDAHSSTSGSPSGKTGSPGDGSNCTQCHSGTATVVPGLITSNIPASGYVPGYTYQITASVTYVGRVKFGFEVSPQSTTGAQKGVLVATNTTETKTLTSGKYITHKSAGTSGTDGRTWTFNWVAPAAGAGTVTFYGAFNCTNNLNNSSGDIVYNSTLTVTEDLSGISETEAAQNRVRLWPTLATSEINLSPVFSVSGNGETSIHIFSVDGRLVKSVTNAAPSSENIYTVDVSSLNSGAYIVSIEKDGQRAVQRFIRN